MKGGAIYSVLRTISNILLVISIISVFASIVGLAAAHKNEKPFVYMWLFGSVYSCVSTLFLYGFCYVVHILNKYVEHRN